MPPRDAAFAPLRYAAESGHTALPRRYYVIMLMPYFAIRLHTRYARFRHYFDVMITLLLIYAFDAAMFSPHAPRRASVLRCFMLMPFISDAFMLDFTRLMFAHLPGTSYRARYMRYVDTATPADVGAIVACAKCQREVDALQERDDDDGATSVNNVTTTVAMARY